MTTRQTPRLATWLLQHLGCAPDNEAILGDLTERYRKGETSAWYWKQVLIVIVLTGFHGPVLVGTTMGIVSGGFSIAGNIARGDVHTVSAFPNYSSLLVAPFITFMVVRYWRNHGSTAEEVRSALRRTAVAYGIVVTLMHLAFVLLWFSRNDGPLPGSLRLAGMFPLVGVFAILLFPLMVLKVRLLGYLAALVPIRGIAK